MTYDPNVVRVQQVGRAVTRNKRSWTWHAGQITLCLLTGLLWLPVYLIKYSRYRSRYTETTYRP